MSDDFELASQLFNTSRSEVAPPSSTSTIYAQAVSDSADGTVEVFIGDDVVSEGEQWDDSGNRISDGEGVTVEIPTSCSVKEGDLCHVTLVGSMAKSPMVTAVTGWGDRVEGIADEALEVAEATSQHFWSADDGAHVTDVTKEQWDDAVASSFSDLSPSKPYHNSLWNSLGMLFRSALNNLVSITRSAIAFFDGNGNSASNIVASFGASGSQIGKTSEAHTVIDSDSMSIVTGDGTVAFDVSVDNNGTEVSFIDGVGYISVGAQGGMQIQAGSGGPFVTLAKNFEDNSGSQTPYHTGFLVSLSHELFGWGYAEELKHASFYKIISAANSFNITNEASFNPTVDLDITGGVYADDNVEVKSDNLTRNTSPSSTTLGHVFRMVDSNGDYIGSIGPQFYTNGNETIRFSVRRTVNNTNIYNDLRLEIDPSGNRSIAVTDGAPWRSGIGAMGSVLVGSYEGLTTMDGTDSAWIRSTSSGFIPHSSNSAGIAGIGTSSWPFKTGHIIDFYTKDVHLKGVGSEIWDNSSGNVHILTGPTGLTNQAEFSFEPDGKCYVRTRTRTSSSASWGSWSSWVQKF